MTTTECENGLGKVGLFVNGSYIYNWGDGQSFNDNWQNLAPVVEQFDVDIFGGHSANDDHHHHFCTSFLATLAED